MKKEENIIFTKIYLKTAAKSTSFDNKRKIPNVFVRIKILLELFLHGQKDSSFFALDNNNMLDQGFMTDETNFIFN
jgi:hypothetical protein